VNSYHLRNISPIILTINRKMCIALTLFEVVIIFGSCSWSTRAAAADVSTITTDADCSLTCHHHVSSQCIGQPVIHVSNDSISDRHWFCGIVEIIPKGLIKNYIRPIK